MFLHPDDKLHHNPDRIDQTMWAEIPIDHNNEESDEFLKKYRTNDDHRTDRWRTFEHNQQNSQVTSCSFIKNIDYIENLFESSQECDSSDNDDVGANEIDESLDDLMSEPNVKMEVDEDLPPMVESDDSEDEDNHEEYDQSLLSLLQKSKSDDDDIQQVYPLKKDVTILHLFFVFFYLFLILDPRKHIS